MSNKDLHQEVEVQYQLPLGTEIEFGGLIISIIINSVNILNLLGPNK